MEAVKDLLNGHHRFNVRDQMLAVKSTMKWRRWMVRCKSLRDLIKSPLNWQEDDRFRRRLSVQFQYVIEVRSLLLSQVAYTEDSLLARDSSWCETPLAEYSRLVIPIRL